MGELVHSEAAARAARAFGIVEHEIGRADVAIYKMMRAAAQRGVKPVRFRLAGALDDVDLHQPVAHQQRACNSGLDGFFVLPAHDEAVHNGVHIPDTGFVECDFLRYIHRLAVDDQTPAALLAQLGKYEIEFLSVDFEDRCA